MHKPFRGLRPLILATAIQLALAGCGAELTPAEYVRKAQTHLDQGDLQAASVELANALKQDPNLMEARWLMAQLALQTGDAARAERDVRQAITFGLPRATGQLTLVRALLLQGDIERALTETSILPEGASAHDRATLLGLRAQALILNADSAQARTVLDKALALDDKATTALVGMAVLHFVNREFDPARSWVMRALEVDAELPEAWSTLGELELAENHPTEAKAAYDKAVKFRKHPSLDRARRAIASIQLKHLDDAAADIEALKQRGWGQHPYVNYVAGLLHFNQENFTEAATALEASLAADPSFLPTRLYLATTRLRLGQTEQALSHAKSLYGSAPNSRLTRELLGTIQMSRADYGAAREMLQTSLHQRPDDRGALQLLSTISLLEGDAAKGLEYAQKVAALEPDSVEAQDALLMAKLIANQDFDFVPAVTADSSDAYTRALLVALNDFRKGRLMGALEQARTLHTQHPDRIDPLNLIAACLLATGQWDAARIELNKTLALQPNEVSAARNLALLEIRSKNVPRAKVLLEQLLAAHPGDEAAALLLADLLAGSGDAEASVAVLETATRNNPAAIAIIERLAAAQLRKGNVARVLELTGALPDARLHARPSLFELKGRAQLLSGDLAGARTTFTQWSKLAPDSALASFLLGDALARSGDVERARKEVQRTLQIDPQYLPARIGEIKALVQTNELAQAQQALSRLRADFGERAEVQGIEGWFALGSGNPVVAEERFAAALKQRADAETTVLLARALWFQGKNDQGFAVLDAWLKEHPQDLGVMMELAGAYLAFERNVEAIATYEKILQANPRHVPTLNNVAWLYRDSAPAKAMEYILRAQNLAPTDPFVLDTLAMLTLQSGDVARAYNLIQEAARRAPANSDIQLHLGEIQLAQGRTAEARKTLDTLLRSAPESAQGKAARVLLDKLGSAAK